MFSPIGNRKKIILSTLFMVLLIWGVQGNLSYASNLSFYGSPTVTPTSVPSGGKFTLSFTVRSQSSADTTTNPDTTADFVTLVAYRTGSTASVGSTVIESLATGQFKQGSLEVTAPSVTATTTRTYTVRIVGSAPTGSDTVTTDNTSSSVTVTVTTSTANLSVTVVPSLYAVIPQQTFNLVATVRNNGTATSSATTLQASQRSGSTNIFNPIGNPTPVPSIAPNSIATRYIALTAPAVPGTYAYRVQIGNGTPKISNVISVTVTNPVDLSVDTPTVDKATVPPGETFTLTTTVTNVGTGNFTGSNITLRYFRSADTTLNATDGTDTQVGTDLTAYISGSSGTTSGSITLTATAPSEQGTYYYYAYVVPLPGEQSYYDPNYNYYDRTANNTSPYVTVTVSAPPDLTVSLYRVRQATFAPGERFTLDATVSNDGTGASAATQLRVYEDSNNNRYGREQEIARHSVSAISAGSSTSERIPLTAPLDAGIYYYRVYIEPITGETATDNNYSNWISIDVLAPLVLESLQPSKGSLKSGESFTLTAIVKNDGTARSAGTTVRYYRSTDNTLSSKDTRVGSRTISGLAAGATTQVSISLSAPQAPGTYYYGACVGDSQTYSGDACMVIKLTVLAIILPESQRPPMYWVDAETGRLQSLTGPDVQRFVQSVQNATGIAVDTAAGKIYWTEQTGENTGRVRRANLNGSNVQLVKELNNVPYGIAVDASNGKLYVTNSRGKVQRFNFDGKNFEWNFITNLASPGGIAVDAAGGKVYWTEQTGESTGRIRRADLDGSNVQLVRELNNVPYDIAVYASIGKLYVTNSRGKVQRFNLDGSNFEWNFIVNLDAPRGIAVDAADGRIYWTARGKIQRANLNGRNVQDVVTGLGAPAGIVLNVSPPPSAAAAAPSAAAMSPNATALHANYPNPFNPETWIPYQLQKAADVEISIHDQRGILVRQLSLGYQVAGQYLSRSRAAYWDGRNHVGEPVASGLYFYTLTAGDFSATRKMLILK